MRWSLLRLEARLRERAKAPPDESYTRWLLDKGPVGCAKKLGEEATELVIAAVSEADDRLVYEAADIMYHLLVLLMARKRSFSDVEAELRRREGISGLAEKAARTGK